MRRYAFLLVAFCLMVSLPELVSAQILAQVTDMNCDRISDCPSGTNCSVTTFTAPLAGGVWHFKVSISCPNPGNIGCKYCLAKACLYDLTLGQMVEEIASNNEDCTDCANDVEVNLHGGHQYRLTVCKFACGSLTCGTGNEQCNPLCAAISSVGR